MRPQVLIHDGFQRCPYLPGQVARLPLYRQLGRLSAAESDARFANAERRVGDALYRPTCPTCQACKGIRVLTHEFRPSKSQRRVLNRWPTDARVEVDRPTVTDEKLALYHRHKRERGLAEPDDAELTAVAYHGWLVHSCTDTVEMRYYFGDRLVGVGILDVGQESASSVYFYFDPSPDVARYSPGVYSALQEIELCRRTGRKHLYLGLWVRDCAQLSYKASYQPCEIRDGGGWRRYTGAAISATEPAQTEG